MKQVTFTLLLAGALLAWPMTNAMAADGHDHGQAQEEDAHDDHDDHDEHAHEQEAGDAHDDHGGHDEHEGHGHDEEEGKTSISSAMAKKAGIKTETAASGVIAQEVVLNGQVTLNQNRTARVKARFPGIVRDVPVTLGQKVQKGEVLARLESNESLRDYTITAPLSGVILERNTNIGDVADGETLFVIADLSTVWAKFHIFPKDADAIEAGQQVRVHTVEHDEEALSKIDLFLPTADALSQTHVAIVELDNADNSWRPGLTIDGHVSVSTQEAGIVVPTSALQTMEDQTVLFVVNGEEYETRIVETGKSSGLYVEILSGLQAGESYVSEGSFIIKADVMKSGAGHDHGH